MDLEPLINTHYEKLNENDRHIANYILRNKEEVQSLSIVELAENMLTSKSTVLRFAQKLGFSGFTEFKYALNDYSDQGLKESASFVQMQENDLNQTAKLFNQQNITPILEAFHKADSIFCFGTGWGQRDVLNTFTRSFVALQKYLIHLESERELEMVIENSITEKDFVIVLSLSGERKPSEELLQTLKIKKVPVLSITNMSTNRLASYSTYNLYFQAESINELKEDVYSLLPLFQIMDLFFRAYVDFIQED